MAPTWKWPWPCQVPVDSSIQQLLCLCLSDAVLGTGMQPCKKVILCSGNWLSISSYVCQPLGLYPDVLTMSRQRENRWWLEVLSLLSHLSFLSVSLLLWDVYVLTYLGISFSLSLHWENIMQNTSLANQVTSRYKERNSHSLGTKRYFGKTYHAEPMEKKQDWHSRTPDT